MKNMFRVMTATVFAALLGSSAIAQAATPVATSNQQLSAKELLRTQPQSTQLLTVPQPPPAFSTINICYGRCGGTADDLKLPNSGEMKRDTQAPVVKIFGNIQPFLGTPMDPNAIGAKVPIFTMP